MSVTVLLHCNDLEQTRKFYGSVLGFNVSESTQGTLTVEKHGGKLIFTQQDLWKSQPACSGTIYFTIPDADNYYATVKDKASISWPLQDMSYGSREFGVSDCNGYSLAFQQQV